MHQGFRFIFTHAGISFVMISMASGMFAVRCFGTLLSVYVRDILHMKEGAFGVLNSMIGLGMISGTQVVRRFAVRSTPQHMVVYGMTGMGVAIFITALFGLMSSTVVGMVALGFFAAFIFITANTLVQHETPPEMLGRVSSSLMSLLTFSQVLSMFVAGPAAEAAGIRNLYFASAVMLAGIGAIGFWKLRGPAPERVSL
jgi:predicted MFS family arabinose efflux permease